MNTVKFSKRHPDGKIEVARVRVTRAKYADNDHTHDLPTIDDATRQMKAMGFVRGSKGK